MHCTTIAQAREESLGDNKPADDLLNLEGVDRDLAFKLVPPVAFVRWKISPNRALMIWLISKG